MAEHQQIDMRNAATQSAWQTGCLTATSVLAVGGLVWGLYPGAVTTTFMGATAAMAMAAGGLADLSKRFPKRRAWMSLVLSLEARWQ